MSNNTDLLRKAILENDYVTFKSELSDEIDYANKVKLLRLAIDKKRIEMIGKLLDIAPIVEVFSDGETPLSLFIKYFDFNLIGDAIICGAYADYVFLGGPHKGQNYVHIAAINGSFDNLKFLLEITSININHIDNLGLTPLDMVELFIATFPEYRIFCRQKIDLLMKFGAKRAKDLKSKDVTI